jgi:MinD-like ATPase involved in chromosome partitioning or flagellar assembly
VIIAVGCWRGTGATTAALLIAAGLAASDEAGAWLIEADPAGGSLAGRMQLPGHTIGGLERVAFPTERGAPADAFAAAAHSVAGLRVVTAPADPFRAYSCHQPRLPWATALKDLPGSVVVDVGRLRAGSPVGAIVAQVDTLLVVAAPEISAAVSAAEWLQAGGRTAPTEPALPDGKARLVFVEAPGGVAFPRATLAAELGGQCAGWLPWDGPTVDLLHRGAPVTDRRVRRSPLAAAVNQLVLGLTLDQVAVR